jgi:prophage tail gpP-like protein
VPGVTLKTVADRLARPFGIQTDFFDVPSVKFEKDVSLNVGKKILDFLVELAAQHDIVIGSSQDGKLLFRKSNEDVFAQAEFIEGQRPLVSVVPNFDEQNYFSHVTGLQPETLGIPGAKYTRSNPHLKGVSRPFTFGVPDTIGADVKTSVDAKMGRMFASAVSYTVTVPTWRNPRGVLWGPNTYVALDYPSAMIYGRYEFLIRSVTFEADAESRSATLELVLPGVFNGKIPSRLPWQE